MDKYLNEILIAICVVIALLAVVLLAGKTTKRNINTRHYEDQNSRKEASYAIVISVNNFDDLFTIHEGVSLNKIRKVVLGGVNNLKAELSEDIQVKYIHDGKFLIELSEFDQEIGHMAFSLASYLIRKSISVENITYNLDVSVGVGSGTNCVDKAIIACKEAKRRGQLFLNYKDLRKDINRSVNILNITRKVREFEKALEEERIVPVFHPIVNTMTKSVSKFEALGRIMDEDGKLKPVHSYLKVIKDVSLREEFNILMFNKTFSAASKLPYDFSFNLDVEDLRQSIFVDFIIDTLSSNPSVANRIVFEVLENEGEINSPLFREFHSQIRKYGSQIAIDDFGAGASNFERLIILNPRYIKMDGGIVKRIHTDKTALMVAASISAMTRAMGIECVAEFVSDEQIYNLMKKLKIDYCQGHYFYTPLTYEELMSKFS